MTPCPTILKLREHLKDSEMMKFLGQLYIILTSQVLMMAHQLNRAPDKKE